MEMIMDFTNVQYKAIIFWILNILLVIAVLRSKAIKSSHKPFIIIVFIFLPIIGPLLIWLFHPAFNRPKNMKHHHGNDAKSDTHYINQGFGSDE
jgi:hypothetical protein